MSRIKMHTGRSARRGERKAITSGLNVKWITRKYRDRDLLNLAGNRSHLRALTGMRKESINSIFRLFRYNAPANYRPPAVSPRFQPEYRSQYRSQYTPQYQGQQLQSVYPSTAIPADSEGHVATNIDVNAGLASYTVNYKWWRKRGKKRKKVEQSYILRVYICYL